VFVVNAGIRHVLRPARGGAAGVIVVFAILLSLAVNAGLFGLPLGLILLSWFFKYAYILFDHVVRGVDDPPTLDIEMVNPLNEQRPLALLAIVLLLYAAIALTAAVLPGAVRIVLALMAMACVPACIALLGLESNLFKALNPVALIHLVRGLGMLYGAVLGLILIYVLLLGLVERSGLWLPGRVAIEMFAVLSLFSSLGGALYERRHELGLETWHSPERTADLERAAELKRSEAIVTEAYGLVRVGAHAKAGQMLKDWLAARNQAVEDYRWLCGRVAAWSDPRYANRLTEEWVERLLTLKRNGEALDVVGERLRLDPTFRPKSAAATLQVAQLAAQGGGARPLARILLKDFGQRFAGDPRTANAEALARHLGE
jgi:hypothetical protein